MQTVDKFFHILRSPRRATTNHSADTLVIGIGAQIYCFGENSSE